MPTQHIATLLGATCCVRLATLLRHVATCWVLLAQIWPFSNLSQQHPTCRNTSQHGGQTNTTCCAQQCCDMLRRHVAIVWPGLKTKTKTNYLPVRPPQLTSNCSKTKTKRNCLITFDTQFQTALSENKRWTTLAQRWSFHRVCHEDGTFLTCARHPGSRWKT